MRVDDFINKNRSSGVLYINIYPIVNYPKRIRVSRMVYDEGFSSGKWKKRVGNSVYYYGNNITEHFEEIVTTDALFAVIFRKYLLDVLSEKINDSWQLKKLSSVLKIVKDINETYSCSDKVKLQYELIIGVHHWQNTNFGLIADVRINIIDRETQESLSYPKIKDRYGENVRKSIWYSVQAFHKHLTFNGKKYATAMQEKFNLITGLLKDGFNVSNDAKVFETPDGELKIVFKPIKIIEVTNDVAI